MNDEPKQKQKTDQGYEIPVPTREQVLDDLAKTLKPKPKPKRRRPRKK